MFSLFSSFCLLFCMSRRRSLHQYDPPDLTSALEDAGKNTEATPDKNSENTTTVQDEELAEAKAKGLLLDFRLDNEDSPVSVVIPGRHSQEMKELDEWDAARGEDCFVCSDAEDSDDDLL